MGATELKRFRAARGWSQQALAEHLRVTQAYVAMLEAGRRPATKPMQRKLVRVLGMPATLLPHSVATGTQLKRPVAARLAEQLAALGYPGLAWLPGARRKRNPADVLLEALAQPELEARLVEALPWLLATYPQLDREWLVSNARTRNLTNRAGFVTALARQVAARVFPAEGEQGSALRALEEELEDGRLAKEDTLCREGMSAAERAWLREHRSETAAHWNLLTDWRVEHLSYATA